MDLIGLGWRSEIGPSILSHLDKIDIVEVILDDYLNSSTARLRALKTLESQVPILYHGVGLGLATSFKVNQKRVDKISRVFDFLTPAVWSEHLAFVRAEHIEIGHLAAPPRNERTVHGTLENLEIIKKHIGSYPLLENIATLIDPPHSSMSEPLWVKNIAANFEGGLLLDLHNLYSNAVNFGFDPVSYLKSFPLDKVRLVHLSGGEWIQEPKGFETRPNGMRLLDDHIHDIPTIVFNLLGILGESVPQALTVIIERDGEYPRFEILLQQIAVAREILKNARLKRLSMERTGGLLECRDA